MAGAFATVAGVDAATVLDSRLTTAESLGAVAADLAVDDDRAMIPRGGAGLVVVVADDTPGLVLGETAAVVLPALISLLDCG